MGSLLRHHPGGVSVRSERPGITGPWGRRRRGTRGPARSRERPWGTQECTQIGENGLSTPFWGICVHCCDAGVARAAVGGAGVYTDWLKWPLDAVLGHLCTLLRRGVARADGGDAGVYTDWRKWPLGVVSGHLCTLLRHPVASGGANGAVARSASSSRRQPTQTSKDLKVINASLWEKRDDR